MDSSRSRLVRRALVAASLAGVLAALGLGACLNRAPLAMQGDAGVAQPAPRSDGGVARDGGALLAADAGVATADAGVSLTPRPLVPDGGCPSPARITPVELPSGFLAPVRVRLQRAVDGDTAHFDFPDGGPQAKALRFLWVNTEESYGADTTPFGVHTSEVINGYLRVATEIIVANQEDRQRPGLPASDVYGRWLGVVFVDGELFQTRIVREGWSPYYTPFGCGREPIHSALLYAEAEARLAELGVWSRSHPRNYEDVLYDWIGSRGCRPNPYESAACR